MNKEKGQVVLILVLVMTVALAIGISVIQRSLSDISTASKTEQSSRAFSAAEAGIEKAIQEAAQGNYNAITSFDLDNNAKVDGVDKNRIPAAEQALEYPPLAKEELAQVWLANPDNLTSPYNGNELEIYWGLPNITADKPAIEITVIYKTAANEYRNKKFFFDSDQTRASATNFTYAACSNPPVIDTSMGNGRRFFCNTTLSELNLIPTLMLLRARFLYSGTSQPFAVKPSSGLSLPPQATLFISTGISGQTQRKVQVFRLDKVVPPYFDYAIFSSGAINK